MGPKNQVAVDVTKGLNYIHDEKDLIHRNVKSNNVLFWGYKFISLKSWKCGKVTSLVDNWLFSILEFASRKSTHNILNGALLLISILYVDSTTNKVY